MDAAVTLLESLEDNTTLEAFDLAYICEEGDTAQCAARMTTAIANVRSLKKLHINVDDRDPQGGLGSIGFALRGIAQNDALSELHLGVFHVDEDDICVDEQDTLDTIKNTYSVEIKQLEVAMEKNTALKEVEVVVDNATENLSLPLSDKTLFWMELNQVGRKELTDDPQDRKLWINTLIEQRDNLKITFHLILSNPTLLAEIGTSENAAPTRRRKKGSCTSKW